MRVGGIPWCEEKEGEDDDVPGRRGGVVASVEAVSGRKPWLLLLSMMVTGSLLPMTMLLFALLLPLAARGVCGVL